MSDDQAQAVIHPTHGGGQVTRRAKRYRRACFVTAVAVLPALGLSSCSGGGSGAAGGPRLAGKATSGTGSGNLLVGDQGNFDSSSGGWVGSGASVAQVSSPTQAGTGALSMTTTGTGPANAATISGNGPSSWTPAQPGQVYTGSIWAQPATTARPFDVILGFISASGAVINTVWGQSTQERTSSWTQAVPVVAISPPGTSYVELAAIAYGTAQGEVHYLDTASLTTRPPGSKAVAGPLNTYGNVIYDSTYHQVTLRGASNDWLDWQSYIPAGSSIDDNSIAHMKQWGLNVVRVLLSEDFWNSNDCHYVSGYDSLVDQTVQSITSRGMVAMLDDHSNQRNTGSCDPSVQQRMADSPGSIQFWKSVATRYKNNPLVGFDLYNEPHDITWAQWLNGGQLTDPDGVTWQAAGMQQLYNTVRKTGARNLVFVTGGDWGNSPPPSTSLVSGNNIVYAAHYYTCPTQPPPTCTNPNPYDPTYVLNQWTSLASSHPVAVTEFGWPDNTNGTYNQNVINWAESKGIGWTPYAFYQGGAAGSTSSFGFLADQTVYEPAASGMPILSGLAANS